MIEHISREAAADVLCDACGNAACPSGRIPRCSYYEKMMAIPAADVRPVKRKPCKYCRKAVPASEKINFCAFCGREFTEEEKTCWIAWEDRGKEDEEET